MKTELLIDLLATAPEPVERDAPRRRHVAALGWGAFGATLLMALILGVRDDLAEAARVPMFWVKLAYPLVVAWGALLAAERLGQPGREAGRAWQLAVLPVAVVWLLAAWALARAGAGERLALLLGETALECPLFIGILSVPVLAATLWAMQGLAPTRPALAGAAAGLLAGAVGTAVYALHCPEMAAPFLASWYLLGMLLATAAGTAAGPLLFRW